MRDFEAEQHVCRLLGSARPQQFDQRISHSSSARAEPHVLAFRYNDATKKTHSKSRPPPFPC
jgi:hypothetical protein